MNLDILPDRSLRKLSRRAPRDSTTADTSEEHWQFVAEVVPGLVLDGPRRAAACRTDPRQETHPTPARWKKAVPCRVGRPTFSLDFDSFDFEQVAFLCTADFGHHLGALLWSTRIFGAIGTILEGFGCFGVARLIKRVDRPCCLECECSGRISCVTR